MTVPFLSSIVTVSLLSFIKNLDKCQKKTHTKEEWRREEGRAQPAHTAHLTSFIVKDGVGVRGRVSCRCPGAFCSSLGVGGGGRDRVDVVATVARCGLEVVSCETQTEVDGARVDGASVLTTWSVVALFVPANASLVMPPSSSHDCDARSRQQPAVAVQPAARRVRASHCPAPTLGCSSCLLLLHLPLPYLPSLLLPSSPLLTS